MSNTLTIAPATHVHHFIAVRAGRHGGQVNYVQRCRESGCGLTPKEARERGEY